MGRASRSNPRANGSVTATDGSQNPDRTRLLQRSVNDRELRQQRHLGKTHVRVGFTDRSYVVDPRGTFRRVMPTPPPQGQE